MDCIFCKINKEEIPSYTVYEDDLVRAFLDINPDSLGHMLVIPKDHYTDIENLSEEVWSHLLKVTKQLKKLLEEKLNIDGVTLIQNNGIVQEVKHFHLHLKPVYKGIKESMELPELFDLLTK